MLKVTKIIEGGIDLETREELSRSIVISNGRREIHVAVNDNVIKELVALFSENGVKDLAPAPAPVPQPRMPRPPPSPRQVASPTLPFDDGPPDPPFGIENLPPENEGFEPGEEFTDRSTGVGSL